MNRVVITFLNTHDAIAAQRTLDQQDLGYRVLPTPEQISSNCGIAVMIPAGYFTQYRASLITAGIDAVYTAAHVQGKQLCIESQLID